MIDIGKLEEVMKDPLIDGIGPIMREQTLALCRELRAAREVVEVGREVLLPAVHDTEINWARAVRKFQAVLTAYDKQREPPMAKAKSKPECFCCYWHIDDDSAENAPSVFIDRGWSYSSEDARRLAAWLVQAADYLDAKATEQGK